MQNNFGKIGFVLAVLGSSIGLGHIWRFPAVTGTSGGAAFVLVFLGISIVIGCAMLIAEMLIGQQGRKNVPDSFKVITGNPNTKWRFMGVALFAGPIILTFYCVVLGWVLYYLFFVSFNLPQTFDESGIIFEALISSNKQMLYQIVCFGLILIATAYSIVHGIKGIEKLNIVLIPLLFCIFFGLLCYAAFLPKFTDSLIFMFKPDFSKIDSNVLVNAMGQVFFSLSIGAGTILTYSSHSSKNQNLLKTSLYILIPGIIISIMAGLIIFTFVFTYGSESNISEGPGLIFVTLPVMFEKFGSLGTILCFLFMAGLIFAGISSTVSLLEPCIKYICDRSKYPRYIITYSVTFGIFVCGIFIILSMNAEYGKYFTILGKSLFDIADWLSANILLTWCGFFFSIFIAYVVPKQKLREWTKPYFKSDILFFSWLYSLRVLAPIMVCTIFIRKLSDLF
ncbi:sodium-dependent transporter [Helicobacter muridarum]|uniref:Sodium-dependent transporter n=1 Tax=Helicobacter muridarum TaxID=216 RepID=A0A099TVY0_9HELI|nr:sodium-dependent transporter [Helicobacter muridarum]TLE01162.1 sodium-dependent transporter [Helicobacter muridarum]STQ86033.1 transmembrane transport protein [Helicobacter muridarum]